jgi:putative photosynthetic complex assembly protein
VTDVSQPLTYQPFPRFALVGAGILIVSVIAFAGITKATGRTEMPPVSTSVASAELLFRDQPDGAVTVLDATASGDRVISVLPPETNGFARALLRGLARERKLEDASFAVPFRVTAWSDGRLTLEDTTTHRHVELEAFGETNEAVFARLLTAAVR